MGKRESGDIRFDFGENWSEFQNKKVNSRIIAEAKRSLREWTGLSDFKGKKFLDIGTGSGLFSLAAWEMGAEKVYSFDYDKASVECARRMQKRAARIPTDACIIERGNVLDGDYMKQFYEQYDIVYSWGVLHHTGNMKCALDLAGKCAQENGLLFISIYNDQGRLSEVWKRVKKAYNKTNNRNKKILIWLSGIYLYGWKRAIQVIRNEKVKILKDSRGMDEYIDLIDWVGGYPFEVATAEKIITFYLNRGFLLKKLFAPKREYGGCNQFVFVKNGK